MRVPNNLKNHLRESRRTNYFFRFLFTWLWSKKGNVNQSGHLKRRIFFLRYRTQNVFLRRERHFTVEWKLSSCKLCRLYPRHSFIDQWEYRHWMIVLITFNRTSFFQTSLLHYCFERRKGYILVKNTQLR